MKQVHKNKFSWLCTLVIAMLLMPFAAFADDIGNNLDTTVDATAEVMPLNVGGPNGTTTLYVVPTGGDGKSGCNLTGSTTLSLSVSSSNTSAATVSPSSVTFTSCGDTKALTVTPVAQGSATISVSQTSNTTGGTFNLAPATFTVNVAPPAITNTAPTVAVAGVTGGASYDKGSVPAATCQVTDAEDGNSSFPATLSAVTGPYASDGIGSQTASCSYTDGGGLTASASETYGIVDSSAPSIGYTLNPTSPDGSNGWYTSNVSLTWNVSDSESPNSLQTTGCANQSITADQAATSYFCSATSAGGTSSDSVSIKRDATAPSLSGAPTTSPNAAGWYKDNVTIDWTASDAISGLAGSEPADSTISSEGTGLTASASVSDNAGNTTNATSSPAVKIDKTAPDVSLEGGPANGASYYFGSVPAAPTCSASDALSGLDGSCSVAGYSTAVGAHTVTASASDKAGNSASASATYTVLAWTLNGFYQPVDMGGVLNTVKGGSTVPLKFEVFAGSTELTATSVVKSFVPTKIACDTGATIDDIELTTTGGTSLRYDATAGQFVQNWQTPKTAGVCYRVTMTTQDGSSISADFRLR